MYDQPKQTDTFNAFVMAVFAVNTTLMAAGDTLTKSVGQSSARWRVLGRISHKPQTVSQIARTIGFARQSVQRVADDLVAEELATYEANPGHKRAQLVQLTFKGQQTLQAIEARQQEWVSRLMPSFRSEELAELAKQLQNISERIEIDRQQHNV